MSRVALDTLRAVLAAAAGLAWFCAASIAQACPACQGHSGGGAGFGWILAGMILLPFPTAGAIVWVIRRQALDSSHRDVNASAEPAEDSSKPREERP